MRDDAGPPQVLLVEHAGDLREMYALYLRQVGLIVETAASFAEARERATKVRPDVLVVDVFLVGSDDDARAGQLRADEATRDVPLVGLCGTILKPEQAAFASQCDALLMKPCLPEDLAAEIRLVLGLRLPALG